MENEEKEEEKGEIARPPQRHCFHVHYFFHHFHDRHHPQGRR
jgi:hypothetical protein